MKASISLVALAALAVAGCPKKQTQQPAAPEQPPAAPEQQQPETPAQPDQPDQEPDDDSDQPNDESGHAQHAQHTQKAAGAMDHFPYVDPGASEPEAIGKAVAVLVPTKGNKARGTIHFEQQSDGVSVSAKVEGLRAGAHAYHIHVYGDCTAENGSSADTHFNFDGSSLDPPDDINYITGNLGELRPGKDGKVTDEVMLPNASLRGAYSIIGRSVVVHERGNDPNKPPLGDAGKAVACGVIGITK